jgi:hypothetical protein
MRPCVSLAKRLPREAVRLTPALAFSLIAGPGHATTKAPARSPSASATSTRSTARASATALNASAPGASPAATARSRRTAGPARRMRANASRLGASATPSSVATAAFAVRAHVALFSRHRDAEDGPWMPQRSRAGAVTHPSSRATSRGSASALRRTASACLSRTARRSGRTTLSSVRALRRDLRSRALPADQTRSPPNGTVRRVRRRRHLGERVEPARPDLRPGLPELPV